jgi:cell volume regulation protein A
MFDIYQIVWIVLILLIFGSLSFYLAKRLKVPRVALTILFGFFCGMLGILNRDWFDPTGSTEFPLGDVVQFVLIIVLFYGGYSIDIKSLKGIIRPGTLLATVGAFMVAFLIALIVNLVFPTLFGIITAIIIGGLIEPNDPIAVQSTMSTFSLNPKANTISKFESGLDDTMVTTLIILICIPLALSLETSPSVDLPLIILNGVLDFLWLSGSAVAIGVGVGYVFYRFYRLIPNKDLRMLANVILPFLAFTVASIPIPPDNQPISSGFVAVFFCGLIFGRKVLKEEIDYKPVGKIWGYAFQFCEIFCFMILGVLVQPSMFTTVFLPAIVITLSIIFITRPLQVAVSTLKTDLKFHDKVFISYIGLKGLDPVVLSIAAFSALNGLTNTYVVGYDLLIDLTFTIIMLITVFQSIILTLLFGSNGYYTKKLAHTAFVDAETSK